MAVAAITEQPRTTEILAVDQAKLKFSPPTSSRRFAAHSTLDIESSETSNHISRAAEELRHTDTPVAFPTETVYGLGADATRSSAVRNIFAAKGRPADNPLIVHIHSLNQLKRLLRPRQKPEANHVHQNGDFVETNQADPIPSIYKPLIEQFWPGPLTIILPLPSPSPLASEVTAGLSTFGARMPSHPVALALLTASDVPLAAPSANASTKPSPTSAQHVYYDLKGKISTIIDGGACGVGVESTVVDGLGEIPAVLRPGGISLEQLRECRGWEGCVIGYQDQQSKSVEAPKAPGMKYRHYSPKAKVILFEHGSESPSREVWEQFASEGSIGIIRTIRWESALESGARKTSTSISSDAKGDCLESVHQNGASYKSIEAVKMEAADNSKRSTTIWDVALGKSASEVAHGLFAALRLLDLKGVSTILVEGIDDSTGSTAAAVMNRLRKAAEIKI